MSSPRTRIITLNLGSQSIELAEFRAQPQGGLILCGSRSREHSVRNILAHNSAFALAVTEIYE
jgi:hypothetical protein